MGAFVALLLIDLHFPEAGSLKGKRKELQSVKSRLHLKYGAAVAEVAHHDVWQRSTLSVALTSGSLSQLEHSADALEDWLHGHYPQGVGVRRHIVSATDLGAERSDA